MGMEEEILQLTVEVKNAAQITATDAQLKAMEGTVASLTADFKSGAIAEEQFLAAMKQAATQAGQLEAQLKTLKTPAGFGGLDKQSITGLSYSLNDFFAASGGLDQRLNAIANNLPMLLSRFGSLGLVLSGVVPIVAMLYKNWDSLIGAMDTGRVKDFVSEIDALNAKIKQIDDKPHKLTVDVQDLRIAQEQVEQIKAALAAVDKLTKSQAFFEKQSGASIGEMFAESRGGAQGVRDALRDGMMPEVMDRATAPIAAKERAKRKELDQANELALSERDPARLAAMDGNIERLKKELDQLKEKRLAAVDDVLAPGKGQLDVEVGRVLDRAQNGAGAEQAENQKRLADLLRKSGQGDLARGVEAAGPRQQQLNDQIDQELETQLEAMKAARKSREEGEKKHKEAQQQVVDDLNKSRSLDQAGQGFARAANATGAAAEDAFAEVRKQITASILSKIEEKGLSPEGAGTIANAAAESIAGRAFEAVGKNATRGEKAAAAAGKKGATAAGRDALKAAQLEEDEAKAGVKRVETSVGKPYQARFEAAMARNAAANAQGGGIDPAEMERRLRLEMFRMIKARGNSPEVAQRATSEIAGKGNADLARRMAELGGMQGTNQERLITLAGALAGEMEHAVGVQVRHRMMIGEVARKVEATQRTGRNRR